MIRNISNKLLLVFGLFTLAFIWNCAPSAPAPVEDVLLPEIDVAQVKDNSDEALKLSRETKLDIEAINTKLIEIDNRLLIIGEELASLSAAKMEELENRIAILSEELRFLDSELKKTQNLTSVKGSAFGNTFTPNPKPQGDKPKIEETESQAYKQASDLFYARKYSQAIQEYNRILEKYPEGTYADNAIFWKGECQFAMGNYAKAIASYQRVFTFPSTEKADDAQYKIGLAYLRMGDKTQSRAELEKLLSLYPDSEYVGRAKQELRKIQ